ATRHHLLSLPDALPILPPGPINQPSDSSLIAALYPAQTGYLYFVAQPDGKHIFSASYADHLAAIKRVRQRPPPVQRPPGPPRPRSEEHTSALQSRVDLV